MNEAERKSFYKSRAWRDKRQEIVERDNGECQHCKLEGKVTTVYDMVLEVDHIKELKDYPELALDDDNLQTLCKECHNKKHNRFHFTANRTPSKWDADERW